MENNRNIFWRHQSKINIIILVALRFRRKSASLARDDGHYTLKADDVTEQPIKRTNSTENIPQISNQPHPPKTAPPSSANNTSYSPSGDYSKQTTSVLMGFSSKLESLPLIGDYRESKIVSNYVYGAPLSTSSKVGKVPVVVEECVRYLETSGLREEGLLRLAGSSSETKTIKESFDRGEIPNFSKLSDVNSVGDALKLYLRNLPTKPLLMTKGIKEASMLKDQKQMVSIMSYELAQIPEVNYFTLKRIFGLMRAIANNVDFTLMSPENISIVFHPTLQLPQNIITLLITQPQVWIK